MAAVRLLLPVVLLSTFIYTATCKSAILTPHNTVTDGARVFNNINDVKESNNLWHVNVLAQNSWDFIISLDNTYGFDPTHRSEVTITVRAPAYAIDELLFGITTNNNHFVSMAIPLLSQLESNQIYPSCVPSIQSASSFAMGDIASLPSTNRRCDIAHGSCASWRHAVPAKYNIQMPITFTLEHNPATQILEIYFSDVSRDVIQRCSFGSGFSLDTGLKLYLSGTNPGDSYIIESFEVSSSILAPMPPLTAPQTTTKTPANVQTTAPQTTTTSHVNVQPQTTPRANVQPQTSTTNPHRPTEPAITTLPPPPSGFVRNVFNELCPIDVTTTGLCRDVADVLNSDAIQCAQPHDCCMCARIECGVGSLPCSGMTAGTSGVAGVKDIMIIGDTVTGAAIECQGEGSCSNTRIIGRNVLSIDCEEHRACYNSVITITDPSPLFALNCGGVESCKDLSIEINFSAPDTPCDAATALAQTFTLEGLGCSNDRACDNLHITINNAGCDAVVLDTFECVHPNGCNGLFLDFIGAVEINHCECGPSCLNAVGLGQCYEGLGYLQCNEPRGCLGQVSTVTNPADGFEMICGDVSSCEGAQFTMELTHDIGTPTHKLGKFIFGGENAALGATFTVDNRQGFEMAIELVECAGERSCADTTFILGENAVIEQIVCAYQACEGCVVKTIPGEPGLPCSPTTVQAL
eukprot:259052_1